jgi:hypothetical protein
MGIYTGNITLKDEKKRKFPKDFCSLIECMINSVDENGTIRILNNKIVDIYKSAGSKISKNKKEFIDILFIYGLIEENSRLKEKLKFSISIKRTIITGEMVFFIKER